MKKSVATGIALLAAVALAGCATSGAPAEEDQELTFVTYTGGDAGVKYTQLADDFEAANPGVTVTIEVVPGDDTYDSLVTSRIQANTAPDIFEVKNSLPGEQPYVDAGMLTDLSNEPWVADQLQVVSDAQAFFDGKTYQFISQVDAVPVFYNPALFDQVGIDIPTSWDDFLDAVTEFRAAGITPLAVGAADGWPLVVQASAMAASLPEFAAGGSEAGELIDGTVAFTESDGWTKVLNDSAELLSLGAYSADVSGVGYIASVDEFATGSAAMLLQGTFALPSIRATSPDLEVGTFALPYVAAGDDPVLATSFGAILAIPSNADSPTLAKKFLEFLAQPENLKKFLTTAQSFSPMTGVVPELDPALDGVIAALEVKANDQNLASGLTPPTQAALMAGMQAMWAGSGSAQDTLDAMDRAQAE